MIVTIIKTGILIKKQRCYETKKKYRSIELDNFKNFQKGFIYRYLPSLYLYELNYYQVT